MISTKNCSDVDFPCFNIVKEYTEKDISVFIPSQNLSGGYDIIIKKKKKIIYSIKNDKLRLIFNQIMIKKNANTIKLTKFVVTQERYNSIVEEKHK